jgi:hypothetical protein
MRHWAAHWDSYAAVFGQHTRAVAEALAAEVARRADWDSLDVLRVAPEHAVANAILGLLASAVRVQRSREKVCVGVMRLAEETVKRMTAGSAAVWEPVRLAWKRLRSQLAVLHALFWLPLPEALFA